MNEPNVTHIPRALTETLPHFTVMAIPMDPGTTEIALLQRGENVRSAKNCLSTPAGLLEHGEDFAQGIVRELHEELHLDPKEILAIRFRTIYRNQNGDGFDWVIGVWEVLVDDLRNKIVNAEPDKHDGLVFMTIEQLLSPEPLMPDGTPAVFASNLKPVLEDFSRSYMIEAMLRRATLTIN